MTIDYKYLISLLQECFPDEKGEERRRGAEDLKERMDKCLRDFEARNPGVGGIARQVLDDVRSDPDRFRGKSAAAEMESRISKAIESKLAPIESELCVDHDDLLYTVLHWKDGDRVEGDYERYKAQGGELSKLRYRRVLRERIEKVARQDVAPLLSVS